MLTSLKIFIIALVVFFAIDILWLGIIAKDLYRTELGFLMSPNVNWIAAIVFYIIFVAGLVFFVIQPSLDKDAWTYAIFAGMFFGFVCYATYDLTNLATLENWPVKITLIDLLWGSTLGGLVSFLTHTIVKFLKIY